MQLNITCNPFISHNIYNVTSRKWCNGALRWKTWRSAICWKTKLKVQVQNILYTGIYYNKYRKGRTIEWGDHHHPCISICHSQTSLRLSLGTDLWLLVFFLVKWIDHGLVHVITCTQGIVSLLDLIVNGYMMVRQQAPSSKGQGWQIELCG